MPTFNQLVRKGRQTAVKKSTAPALHLYEMAQVRLEHPEAPLKELGAYLNPPVGKSGVNHRLRKISEIAENMRV